MLKRFPLLIRSSLFIFLPLLIACVTAYQYLKSSLPEYEDTQAVRGLTAKLDISRDKWGIPHIKAATDNDAHFAMGYVHAQDRLWQLELQRRIASGRLSEVFGKASINQDIWFRTLGLYHSAKASWGNLSPDAQASLTAYTAGINAWIEKEDLVLPVEFTVLDVKPEPWTVYDSLAWIKVFALNLGGNYRQEMAKLLASQRLDAAKLATLFPQYPTDGPTTVTAMTLSSQEKVAQLLDLQKQLETQTNIGGQFVGSNGWIVSGQHTDSGLPILANDPHLALQAPSLWYVANVQGDKLKASGMSLVGLPVIVFGHNEHIAWGGTAMMADVQDLYLERVHDQDANLYRVNDQWQAFTIREEIITVKADIPAFLRPPLKPITIQVRSSRHGPIISDIFKLFDQPVALRWTALTNKDSSYESFFRLNQAHDWQTFRQALSHHVAPALNLLYSDRQGNIGYQGIGNLPIRSKGRGTVPVPGWHDEYQWTGHVPKAEMPYSFNPKKGYIVNANNKVVGEDYPYFISSNWAPPTRAQRIEDLLKQSIEAKTPITANRMAEIQGDTFDVAAERMLPLLRQLKTQTARQAEALTYLADWQGDMSLDSPAATLFFAWLRQIRIALFNDELKMDWQNQTKTNYLNGVASNVQTDQISLLLQNDRSGWCNNVSTPGKETCEDSLLISLDAAIEELTKLQGPDMSDWQWGEAHSALFAHTPFSSMKVLDDLFERRIPTGGSPDTVNVASAAYQQEKGYIQQFGAGFRQVMSWREQGIEQLYMNSMGQSGNIMSRHYDDMLEPFNAVQFDTLTADVAKDQASITHLTPKQ